MAGEPYTTRDTGGRPGPVLVCPPPPRSFQGKTMYEIHSYDHMPVSWGYMRAQYPLLMPPPPPPPPSFER